MTDPTSPSAPRHLGRRAFLAAGVVALAATAWRDRDLIALSTVGDALGGATGVPGAAPFVPPELEPIERTRRALERFDEARTTYLQAFAGWRRPTGGPDDEAWRAWSALRVKAWPPLRDALEGLVADALRSAASDPGEGIHGLVAGLAEVQLSVSPGSLDRQALDTGGARGTDDVLARRVHVDDAARLASGLERIEAALVAPRLSFRTGELIAARETHVEGTPLLRFGRGLSAGSAVHMPELLFMRSALGDVTRLAASARVHGEPGRARQLVTLSRRAALSLGAQCGSLMELLVASAALGDAQREWTALGVSTSDLPLVHAATAEARGIREAQDEASEMRSGMDVSSLSVIDYLMMPAGGWGDAVDLDLGRHMEHSLVDSLLVLSLLAVTVLGLAPAAWASRWPRSLQHPAGGFTLGDALGVALPGLVGAAVLGLAVARLDPWRERMGLGSPGAIGVVVAQVVALVAGGRFVHQWLLRRAALAHHGLGWVRPSSARASLGLALGAVALVTQWTAPYDFKATGVGAALFVAALGLGLAGGVLGRAAPAREVDRAVRGYAGRVDLAILGLALVLLGGLECFVVAPRRDALVEATADQYARLMAHEAEAWGGGRPRDLFARLLRVAPAAPVDPR